MEGLENNRDAWFLEFLQNLPALAWAKDGAGRYVFVNSAAVKAFGKPESEILGATDFDIFTRSVAEGFRRNDELAAQKGSPLQTVEVLPDQDGVLRYSLVTKFPVSTADGETYIAGTALDITDQRPAHAHQAFLFGISETIRVATDTDALLAETAEALGKFLAIDRCLFNEIDVGKDIETVRSEYASTGPSVIGQHPVSAYSPETTGQMMQGRTVVNRDSKRDERTASHFESVYEPAGERSYVAVPMMRGGNWVASLWCSSREPRNWTDQETQLIETVAERTWAAVERLRSENALQANFETFLGLIQSAPFGVYLVDSEFRLVQISAGSEKVFRNIDPLIGRDFAEVLRVIWPEPFATETIKIFRHTQETGEAYHSPDTTEQRANEPVVESYDWQLKRVPMPDGKFGVVCYFYDLTELRQAQYERREIEERIRSGEAQVRLITDSIPALVSYIDRSTRYRFVNRRYTQWFGLSSDEILGHTMAEVLGDAAVARLKPHVEKALAGERVDFEAWIDYQGAGRRFVRVSYVPDLSQDGEVAGYYALVTDLTEQQRSGDLLRSSEERMNVLTESFTDYAILSTNPEGEIDSWNPGARNIFGYSEDEIVGRSADLLFTPEDIAAGVPREEMRKARELGRASDERWHVRKDGSRFFASGVMAPLFSAGKLMGYAKIATDLTEKRRQAEELQLAYEEMESRVLDRTRELANANESLREQINERRSVERQRIRLLQRLVTTQEVERTRIARDLHDQLGQRLTALRLKLAALSGLCTGQPEMRARVVRLQQIAELLDSEVSFLTWQLRPTALDELGLADALRTFVGEWSRHYNKPADFHVTALKDLDLSPAVETQVYRITQEALNNVIKHADAASVSVILERVGSLLVLIIEDDGVGFDSDSLSRKPEDKHGLGLAGMRERAELIGGEVEIETARGLGTTIYLRIPMDSPKMEGKSDE